MQENTPAADVAAMRREYSERGITRAEMLPDPMAQFGVWLDNAISAQLLEPNALTLATASADGRVTARTVLLKAYDRRGFVFFTNYSSLKGRQIAENPRVALLFPWLPLERQVAVSGRAEKISTAESVAYFVRRPFGSRVGAWVSVQSRIVTSRRLLEMKFEEMMRKFAGGEVPLPEFWGGYRVEPDTVEFWQGRANRLHDRLQYVREGDGWRIDRLSP